MPMKKQAPAENSEDPRGSIYRLRIVRRRFHKIGARSISRADGHLPNPLSYFT
jgi:hypothetical protein